MDTIIVKLNLSLIERISSGKYNWENQKINEENFPHDNTTVGEWEFRLIHPNKNISSEDVKSLCEADGWQAAKLEHLLAFGESFPEEQRKYPIVELGSSCMLGGNCHIVGLWFRSSGRDLHLFDWDRDCFSYSRFLSVRKMSPAS